MNQGKHWEASTSIRQCAEATKDGDLLSRLRTSDIALHTSALDNPKIAAKEKLRSLDVLERDYADAAVKYKSTRQQLERTVAQQDALAEKQREAAEAKRKRSEGVRIGMSKADVLASNWGRPQAVNTTTTARGTREQWVYGGRNYLYFDDGVLTAIQN